MTVEQPAARLNAVTKDFQEGDQLHRVLRGVDLELRQGELTVLFGRSGAGKSTLLNLLGGLDRPTSGSVEVGGVDVSGMNERELTHFRRHRIGFVFQAFNLINTLTVLENVLLPMELAGRENGREARARALLDRVGLVDRAHSYPDRLSGGEQQRVALVRALAHDPVLVLADEPTGNLDYQSGRGVMHLFVELVRQDGKTMLVVTHDTDFVERADRLLLMREGKVIEATAESVGR
ncbi:MAG: ABC transporter ATP-binding protein [Rhodothermales bacterium]|nr:ABC transporter ATP-binding protein [Rhodothermales bacterium]